MAKPKSIGYATGHTRLGSDEPFRLVADIAPVLMWMSDADMRCTYVNKTWLAFTGRTLEAELGDGWHDCVHPDDIAKCVDVLATALERREPFKVEYRLARYDNGGPDGYSTPAYRSWPRMARWPATSDRALTSPISSRRRPSSCTPRTACVWPSNQGSPLPSSGISSRAATPASAIFERSSGSATPRLLEGSITSATGCTRTIGNAC